MLNVGNRLGTPWSCFVGLIFTVPILLAASPAPVRGQPAYQSLPWISTDGPLGGLGYDIRYNFADPNVWYVTDAWSGVHRSTDRGISWTKSNTGMAIGWGPAGDTIPIFSLTVDPHDPSIVWAGTQSTGQIFKSTDGGLTWMERSNGIDPTLIPHLSFRGFTVAPTGSDTVYAMGEIGSPAWTPDGKLSYGILFDRTKGIVYRTLDGGLNWTELKREESLMRYCFIDPVNPDVLYVSTGIFDREAANTDEANSIPGGVGILKSVTGGASWDVLDQAEGLTDLYIGSLYMRPDDPDVLLAVGSNDAWSRLAVENTAGVFLTENGGTSWQRVLRDELFATIEFCSSDPDIAYAASYQAAYRSEDGGHTWQRFNRPDGTWGSPGLVAGLPIDMQCDPEDPMRIAVNNYLGGNFLSRNGGRTWLSASRGYTGALVRAVAVVPGRPSTVFAGSRSGLFRSEDGGEHWLGTQYPPPEILIPNQPVKMTEITAVAIDPGNAHHILVSSVETGGLLASDDQGRSWRVPSLPAGADIPVSLAFAPANPAVVYAGSANFGCKNETLDAGCDRPGAGVFISQDGGESWLRPGGADLDGKSVFAVEVHPSDPDTVLAGTFSVGLYRSTDRGMSWSQIGAGLPAVPLLDLVIHPQDPTLVFAGLKGAAVYKSVDGGASFVQSSAGLDANALAFSVVVDPTDTQVAYVADALSGVYVSTDQGATWQAINQGLDHRAVKTLALAADGSVLYAGVEGAGVWRLGTPVPAVAVNDACDQAIELGLGSYSELFAQAGADGAASCASPPGADLWYRHTATANGELYVSTCGTHDVGVIDDGIDTVVSVHTACPGTPVTEIAEGCNDNWTTGGVSRACALFDSGVPADGAVVVPVQAGEEVWIRVGRRPPATHGEFWLTLTPGLFSDGFEGGNTAKWSRRVP